MNKERIIADWKYLLKQLEKIYKQKDKYKKLFGDRWANNLGNEIDWEVSDFERILEQDIDIMIFNDGESENDNSNN